MVVIIFFYTTLFFIFLPQEPKSQKEDFASYPLYPWPYYTGNVIPVSTLADNFFPERLFHTDYERYRFLDSFQAIFTAYRDYFKRIEFFYNDTSFDVIFHSANNQQFYFCEGKMLPPEKLDIRDRYVPYVYSFRNRLQSGVKGETEGMPFPPSIEYSFYDMVYGTTRKEIVSSLERINGFGHGFYMTTRNRVAYQTAKAFSEMEEIAAGNNDVRQWARSIRNFSSYSPRSIANDERKSLHSYGIAIDCMYNNRPGQIYWFWSARFYPRWWNIPPEERLTVPKEVIESFYRHGFIWGGSWYYFDIMHFEYRPELTGIKIPPLD